MADQLRIEIIGSLNIGKSIDQINTAIKGIEKKINTVKLNVNINDNVTKTLNNIAKQMDQVAQVATKSGKVIETALLPDGTKVKREYFNGLKNEFSEIVSESKKVKGSINNTSTSVQDQKNRIKELTREYTNLAREAKRYDAAGNLKGTTSTYLNDKGNARVVNTNNVTGDVTYKDINNYQKLIEVQSTLRKELMQLAKTGRYTTAELRQIGQGINLSSTLSQLDKVKRQMSNLQFGTNLQAQQEKLKTSLKGLFDQAKITEAQLKGIGRNIDATKNVAEIDKISKAMARLAQTSDNKALQSKLLSQSNTLMNSSAKGIDKNALNTVTTQLNGIKPNATNAANALKLIENELKRIRQASVEASAASRTLGEQLGSAAGKFGMWIGIGAAVYAPINFVKQMTETIVELDSKLVSLQKVMDRDTNFDAIMRNAAASASEFAKTISETMDTYIEFSRQGYKEDEIPLLADAALIASNVGEMEAGKTAEYLTSALVQMKMEAKDAMGLIDAWNSVSNQNATTVEKLAQGYSRAAAVSQTWGMDMHELNAIIGTVTAATKQSGNEVGNFIKNVLPRLTSAPAQKALDMTGVSLTDDSGNLKSALQIYKEISVEYNKMSQLDQSIVAEGLAGKFHISRMSALLQNMGMVDKMYEDSVDSANSARIENEKYMGSLEARIQKVRLSVEQLYLALGEAFFTESFIQFLEVLKDIAGAATWVTKTIGGLPVILGGVGVAAILMSKGFRTAVVDMTLMQAATKGLTISLRSLGLAFKGLLAATGVGIALGVIGFAIEKLLSASGKARQEMEDYNSRNKELMMSFKDNKDQILDLADAYAEYDSKLKNGELDTKQLQEYNRITQELAGAMPSLVVGEDQYGNKILASAEYVKSKTEMLERQLAVQEKIEAAEKKEQAEADYSTAQNALEDAKKDKDKFLDNLNKELLDIEKSGFSFRIINAKDINVDSIKEVEERIDSLQAKKDKGIISGIEQKTLDSLMKATEEYDRLSLSVEDAKVAMQSSSVAMVNSAMSLDDSFSASSRSMIQDFTMFVATSGSSAEAIDDTLSGIGDKLKNTSFKSTLESYSNAIDTYRDKINEGLGEKELVEYQEKAKSAYDKLKDSILAVANDSGISGEEYNRLSAQLDNSANSALTLDKAIETMAKSTGKSTEELRAALSLTPEVASEMDNAGDSAEQAANSYDKYAESLKNLGDISKQSATASEMLAGITNSQIDGIYEQIAVYQTLNSLESLNGQQKAMLSDATSFLSSIYPQLVKGSKANVDAILKETQANDILLKSVEESTKGQLSSQENQTLHSALGTKARIKMIKAEILALDTMLKAQKKAAEEMFKNAENFDDATGMINAEKIYKRALDKAEPLSGLQDELDKLIPDFEKQINSLGKAIDSQGRVKDANDKTAKSAKEAAKEYKNYTYVNDEYAESLNKVEAALKRIESIQAKYPQYSKQYRNALKDEIKQLEKKENLLNKQAKDLRKQIASGKIKQYGVIETGGSSSGSSGASYSPSGTYGGKYAKEVNAAAQKYGISPFLVASIIDTESKFNPNARSSVGAQGLMQLMPATARGLGVKNSFDPAQNIMGGTKYISQMLKMFGGDVTKALAAYNAGPNRVKKAGGVPNIKETQDYVKKVQATYAKFTQKMATTSSKGAQSIADYYLKGFKKTSDFNESRSTGAHKGIDLSKGRAGDPIKAIQSGKVITATYSKTAGNWVVIQQDDGKVAKYMHMQDGSMSVKAGQRVTAGQNIGKVGNTGRSRGAHLHLQIESNGKAIDPEEYLKGLSETTSKQVAEDASNIADAQREVLGLEQEALDIEQQIQELRMSLIESNLAVFDYRRKRLEDNLSKVDVKMQREGEGTKKWIDLQLRRETLLAKDIKHQKDSIKYLQKEIKNNKNLTAAQKAYLKEDLIDRITTLSDLESQLLSDREKMAEKAIDATKQALEAMKKAATDAIDKMIDAINKEAEEEDYAKNLSDAQKARQKTLDEIAKWSTDDSFEAVKKLQELNEQLQEQDEAIANMQTDRERKLRIDNLNEEKEKVEAKYDNLINDEKKFAKMRSDIINGNAKQIVKDLEKYGKNVKANASVLGKALSNNLIDLINQANRYLNGKDYKPIKVAQAKEGGILPPWGNSGKLMYVHQNEMIANETDTKNILAASKLVSDLPKDFSKYLTVQAPLMPSFPGGISVPSTSSGDVTMTNQFYIDAKSGDAAFVQNQIKIAMNDILDKVNIFNPNR